MISPHRKGKMYSERNRQFSGDEAFPGVYVSSNSESGSTSSALRTAHGVVKEIDDRNCRSGGGEGNPNNGVLGQQVLVMQQKIDCARRSRL